MDEYNTFRNLFKFRLEKTLMLGVERESFLTRNGSIVPIAETVLQRLTNHSRFGYELSACQLEDRVGPVYLESLGDALCRNELQIISAEKELHFNRSFQEVAPPDMPLDIYPDPRGRYQEITKKMSRETLLAACRVIGTHIHVGMPNHETALAVYNKVICSCEELCQEGDGSQGERLRIYKQMAPDFEPRPYADWYEFFEEAVEKNFVTDPRKCWHLIRISAHGTIEFRMFGARKEISQIVQWAELCHKLCQSAFAQI